MVPISWTENSKNEVKYFLTNKPSISGLWVFDWISGYLDTWIPGYLDTWIPGDMDTWISDTMYLIPGYLIPDF